MAFSYGVYSYFSYGSFTGYENILAVAYCCRVICPSVNNQFIIFAEVQNQRKSKLSRLEQWVKYLSATVPAGEEIIPGDEMFTQLSRIEKVYGKDKEELLRYEAAERAEMDFVSAISSAELRGKEIGKAEGKAEGRAEGKKIQAAETAEALLDMGLSLQQITKATGLTEAEILQIKK